MDNTSEEHQEEVGGGKRTEKYSKIAEYFNEKSNAKEKRTKFWITHRLYPSKLFITYFAQYDIKTIFYSIITNLKDYTI